MDKVKEELEKLAKLLIQVNEQVNHWTIRKWKLEGAIEALNDLIKNIKRK